MRWRWGWLHKTGVHFFGGIPHELEMRKLLSVDLLIIDDFGLDGMDVNGSHDIHELMTERHRRGSIILTSNRGPDEWLTTFSDPIRAQAAIDRFTGNAYDLVIEGDTYRSRQKPNSSADDVLDRRATTEPIYSRHARRPSQGGKLLRNRGPFLVRADIVEGDLAGEAYTARTQAASLSLEIAIAVVGQVPQPTGSQTWKAMGRGR
jgi:hypothetical protein